MKRLFSRGRIGCVLLIAAIAAFGYLGSKKREDHTTQAPVFVTQKKDDGILYEMIGEDRAGQALQKMEEETQEQMKMLDGIIASAYTEAKTKAEAMAQKAQLVHRSGLRTQLEACFALMGLRADALVGEQIGIYAEAEEIDKAGGGIRLIEVVSAQTGIDPEQFKIILIKK